MRSRTEGVLEAQPCRFSRAEVDVRFEALTVEFMEDGGLTRGAVLVAARVTFAHLGVDLDLWA